MAKFAKGDKLGRHEVVRFIGAGGMGEVYEARHVDLKRRVAIKCLLENVEGFEDVKRRFLQEGEAAARIQHPHVVAVHDVGTEAGVVYLVMEYLEGTDLQRHLSQRGALPANEVVSLMLPVCAAVAAAHEAGVIHRDLKPANVFLAKNPLGGAPVPKVLDFGISKLTVDPNNALTLGTAVLGTPQFLSPEQALGNVGLDARVDQYAVGVMMYQLLSKTFPYAAGSIYPLLQAIVRGGAEPVGARVPGLDPRLEAVVMRAMAADRTQRFPTMRALGAALLDLASPRDRQAWAPSFDPDGVSASGTYEAIRRSIVPGADAQPPIIESATRAAADVELAQYAAALSTPSSAPNAAPPTPAPPTPAPPTPAPRMAPTPMTPAAPMTPAPGTSALGTPGAPMTPAPGAPMTPAPAPRMEPVEAQPLAELALEGPRTPLALSAESLHRIDPPPPAPSRRPLVVGGVALLVAAGVVAWLSTSGETERPYASRPLSTAGAVDANVGVADAATRAATSTAATPTAAPTPTDAPPVGAGASASPAASPSPSAAPRVGAAGASPPPRPMTGASAAPKSPPPTPSPTTEVTPGPEATPTPRRGVNEAPIIQ